MVTKRQNVRNMAVTRLQGHEEVSFNGITPLKNHCEGVIEWFPQKLSHGNGNLVIITSPMFKGYFKGQAGVRQITLCFSLTVQTHLIGTSTSSCMIARARNLRRNCRRFKFCSLKYYNNGALAITWLWQAEIQVSEQIQLAPPSIL